MLESSAETNPDAAVDYKGQYADYYTIDCDTLVSGAVL